MIDMEDMENSIEAELMIIQAGYLTRSSYEEHRDNSIHGLGLYGDRFEAALGLALKEANLQDSIKIMRYWHSLCDKYSIMYRMYVARRESQITD